jgi:hypothetical protein
MISAGLPADLESWHHGLMARRPAAKRDFMQVARGIVEQAIGEQMDGNPLPEPPKDERNPQHQTLRVTPAMESGVSTHVWSLEELCALLPKAPSSTTQVDKMLILEAMNRSIS